MKRELGEGRWDRILIRRMTELSVADNYNEAKDEWIATGDVWWNGNGDIPDWVHQVAIQINVFVAIQLFIISVLEILKMILKK